MMRDRPTTYGFTLIEVIVALVLGTLLLTFCTQVIGHSFKAINTSSRYDAIAQFITPLREQLQYDFTNARQFRAGINQFELIGFIHRDSDSLIPTNRLARVVYQVRGSGSESILVRVQSEVQTNIPMNDAVFVEPVCVGVASLQITSNQVNAIVATDMLGLNPTEQARMRASQGAVPTSLQIALFDANGKTVLIESFLRDRVTR
jgi:prepilin-type N-terminal cleavage/methylation domain-containing protein